MKITTIVLITGLIGLDAFVFNAYNQASKYENLAMPMLRAVSTSWSEAALQPYLPNDIYRRDRAFYAEMLTRFKFLGQVTKCKGSFFNKISTDKQGRAILNEECKFTNGLVKVQVFFNHMSGSNQITGLDINTLRVKNRLTAYSNTNSSNNSDSFFKIKSKSRSKSRRRR